METQQPQPSSSNMAQESSTGYVDTTLRLSYKVPVLLRLRSAVFSIARLLRIMPESTNPHLAPEFLPIQKGYRYVDSYRDSLRSLYTEPGMHSTYDRWNMIELRTFKDKKNKYRHEYIVATFTDGAKGKVHLRIERRNQVSEALSKAKNVVSGASRPTNSDDGEQGGPLATEQAPDKFTKKAVDDVSLLQNHQLENDLQNRRKKAVVEHIKFPESRISLPKLVLLACAINQQSKKTYHITKKNCYWFCNTMAAALKKHNKYYLVPLKGRDQRGKWLNINADKFYENINIDELLALTDNLWKEFTTQIDDIINNPNNKHLTAANRRAEDEARLRGEAERRAEEEARLKDEEARLRGEAEMRAEEEARLKDEEARLRGEAERRAEEEKRRAEEEKRRAEEEKRRAEEAMRRIAELEAQIAAQAKAATQS